MNFVERVTPHVMSLLLGTRADGHYVQDLGLEALT